MCAAVATVEMWQAQCHVCQCQKHFRRFILLQRKTSKFLFSFIFHRHGRVCSAVHQPSQPIYKVHHQDQLGILLVVIFNSVYSYLRIIFAQKQQITLRHLKLVSSRRFFLCVAFKIEPSYTVDRHYMDACVHNHLCWIVGNA